MMPMYELEKAYETAEMMMALDLPISRTQIEEIWSLEKNSGNVHREDLSTYFYEKCFAYYTKRIMNIRQAKIRGEVIVAKPVLLLALIDGIESEVFTKNKFPLTEWLEYKYVMLLTSAMRHQNSYLTRRLVGFVIRPQRILAFVMRSYQVNFQH